MMVQNNEGCERLHFFTFPRTCVRMYIGPIVIVGSLGMGSHGGPWEPEQPENGVDLSHLQQQRVG